MLSRFCELELRGLKILTWYSCGWSGLELVALVCVYIQYRQQVVPEMALRAVSCGDSGEPWFLCFWSSVRRSALLLPGAHRQRDSEVFKGRTVVQGLWCPSGEVSGAVEAEGLESTC